jgi:hypothetical protein
MTFFNTWKTYAAIFLTVALSAGLCSISKAMVSTVSSRQIAEASPWVPVTVDSSSVVHIASLHLPLTIRLPQGSHLILHRALIEHDMNQHGNPTYLINLFLQPEGEHALESHLENRTPENLLVSPGIHLAKPSPKIVSSSNGWTYSSGWITDFGYANVIIGFYSVIKSPGQDTINDNPVAEKIFHDLSGPVSPMKPGKPILRMIIAIVTIKTK